MSFVSSVGRKENKTKLHETHAEGFGYMKKMQVVR